MSQSLFENAACHPAIAIRRSVELGVRSIEHGTLIDEATAKFVARQGAYVVPAMATIHALKEDGPKHGMPAIRKQALSPFEILRSATSINAEILQMQDQLGVVKPGALADLLLVNGNPLKHIELLEASGANLSVIMKDGNFIKATV